MIRKTVAIEVVEKNDDGGRIIISTGDVDRDNDRVMPFGARVDNYLKNPVVQYGHNYSEPWATVGRTTSLEIGENGIVAEFELRPAANEQDPQNIVRLLWNGDWIRTASIGFAPKEREENDDGGVDFTEWDLLEWSLVPVPANQSALRLAMKALEDAAPYQTPPGQKDDEIDDESGDSEPQEPPEQPEQPGESLSTELDEDATEQDTDTPQGDDANDDDQPELPADVLQELREAIEALADFING
jgi:HK97 family phage prohead protease